MEAQTIQNIIPQALEGSRHTTSPARHFDLDKWVERLKEYAAVLIPGFVVDEYNGYVFRLLTAYFSNHVWFEQEGFDLKKGIYLRGQVGPGKTWMMQFFSRFMLEYGEKNNKAFYMNSCRKIAKAYAEDGHKALDIYGKKSFKQSQCGYGEANILSKPTHRCFDDFGLEENMPFYGKYSNTMAEIVLDRYELFLSHKMLTHFTTNIGNGNQVEELYGDRVRDRLRQMVNDIELHGGSRRK